VESPFGGRTTLSVLAVLSTLTGCALFSLAIEVSAGIATKCILLSSCGQIARQHGAFGSCRHQYHCTGGFTGIGLQHLVTQEKWQIYDATDSMPWPVAGCSYCVSRSRRARRCYRPRSQVPKRAGGSAHQHPIGGKQERNDPLPLGANEGAVFQGSILLGMGFVLTSDERDVLVTKCSKNDELIFRTLVVKRSVPVRHRASTATRSTSVEWSLLRRKVGRTDGHSQA